jgi:hypothetical protein
MSLNHEIKNGVLPPLQFVASNLSLPTLTASQLLATDAQKQVVSDTDKLIYPTRATMWADELTITHGANTLLPVVNINQSYNYYVINNTSANGDAGELSFYLQAGNYVFNFLACQATDAGIIQFYIDGHPILLFNLYADLMVPGNPQENDVNNPVNVTITGSGRHVLSFQITGKNNSSTGYKFYLTKFWFTPRFTETILVN